MEAIGSGRCSGYVPNWKRPGASWCRARQAKLCLTSEINNKHINNCDRRFGLNIYL